MAKELPSYKPSNHTVEAPLTSLLYDPLRSAKGLITTEESYAQIEKECLAIVEALNTFEELLLGKSNRVYTDNQPFQSIFKKDLASAPKCLQKMLLYLQRYNFTIVYCVSTRGDVMSPLGYSRMIISHSKVPVSTRAREV